MGLEFRVGPVLGGMANQYEGTVSTGNRSRNDDCVILEQNIHNLQVQNGRQLIAHLARHAEPLANPARVGSVTDRPAMTEVLVRSARAGKACEIMAFDTTREAVPLPDAPHYAHFAPFAI